MYSLNETFKGGMERNTEDSYRRTRKLAEDVFHAILTAKEETEQVKKESLFGWKKTVINASRCSYGDGSTGNNVL